MFDKILKSIGYWVAKSQTRTTILFFLLCIFAMFVSIFISLWNGLYGFWSEFRWSILEDWEDTMYYWDTRHEQLKNLKESCKDEQVHKSGS